MTTDPDTIRAFVGVQGPNAGVGAQGPGAQGPRLVVCTYQSSPLLPLDAFGLAVFDEAHRVCGGRAARPFNHAVLGFAELPADARPACLYMTATPVYDPPSRTPVTMKDRALFGGVAYRYHLRQGVSAGYVNDFRLEVVAAPAPRTKGGRRHTAGPAAEEAAAPDQLLAAMAQVDKLLVFCRDIAHAGRLCAALAAAARPAGVAPFECLQAHSRLGPGGTAAALRRFAEPGVRAALFNCRLFQEGVEIPALNAVFFAAPRHSPRDIVQSVCRPLNAAPGKPRSVIYLPVLHDPARPPADPENLQRYASIIPYLDALMAEDPRLYEHLLDPAASPYPLELLGAHTLGLAAGDTGGRAALLDAVRMAARRGGGAGRAERLLRTDAIPWALGFGEVRRIVEVCGRYPKTTDAWVVGEARVCLHRFYRWAADEFAAWRAGRPSALEPHQAHDLLTLPGWEPFGVEGPYPWGFCLAYLERWLVEHPGEPPMVNVNIGGYVGLDATPMERLSGALTCINQGDGKARAGRPAGSGFTVSAEKQADLDRLCEAHGLRWRKQRDEAGALVKDGPPTFIQEAYTRFKAYYKAYGAAAPYLAEHFPGFPLKHKRMERLDVQEQKLAPPRWRTGRGRKKAAPGEAENSEGSDADDGPVVV